MTKLLEIPANHLDNIEQAIYDVFGRCAEIEQYVEIVLADYSDWDNAVELHHIFPQAVFGENTITVAIPIHKHFLAHISLYNGYMKHENRLSRIVQSFASGVTAFCRNNNHRLEHIKNLSEDDLLEYAYMVEEARKANSEKSIGCTHFTNIETGKIIFAKECPQGFVRGNKHNKLQYTNPERTICKMFVPGTEPEGWINQGLLGRNAGAKHYIDPTTNKLRFTANPEDWFIPYSPCTGTRHYKNIITGEVKRFENAPNEDWIAHNPNSEMLRVYNIETNQNSFISVDEDIPDGWAYGMSPDICEKLRGRIEVYDLINNEYKWTREELFDSETMIRQGSHTGWTVIYNEDTREHKWHPDRENVPCGWKIGRIDMPSGYVLAFNIESKKVDRFQTDADIPDGWQKGIPYEMIWIYNKETEKESWVPIHRAEELCQQGWEYGRPSMANNNHNGGNFHIYNPETKERATIKDKNDLPDGWIFGLLKNSKPAYKGKKAYHDPVSKQYDYFSNESDVPDGWIRGTGIKKPRKKKQTT